MQGAERATATVHGSSEPQLLPAGVPLGRGFPPAATAAMGLAGVMRHARALARSHQRRRLDPPVPLPLPSCLGIDAYSAPACSRWPHERHRQRCTPPRCHSRVAAETHRPDSAVAARVLGASAVLVHVSEGLASCSVCGCLPRSCMRSRPCVVARCDPRASGERTAPHTACLLRLRELAGLLCRIHAAEASRCAGSRSSGQRRNRGCPKSS